MKCSALLDTGVGVSYVWSKFISLIKKKTGLNWNQNNADANEYFKQKDTNLFSTNIRRKTPI